MENEKKLANKDFASLITIIIVIIAISFSIDFFAGRYFPREPVNDGRLYDALALDILSGNGYTFQDNYILAPGYPLFITAIYAVFGRNFEIVFFIQYLLHACLAVAILLISVYQFRIHRLLAICGALMVVCWPYFIMHANMFYSETLYSLLLIASIALFLKFLNSGAKANLYAAFAGAMLGLASLTRPICMLLAFWLAAAFLLNRKLTSDGMRSKTGFKPWAVLVTVFMLTLLPWIIFSSQKTGQPTPVASSWKNVVYGSISNHEYSYYFTPGYEPGAEMTLKKIVVAKLRNIYRFWKSGIEGSVADSILGGKSWAKYPLVLYRIGFYSLVLLALLSVKNFRNENTFLLLAVVAYFWAVHTALFPSPRFTLPVIPLVILLAISSVDAILRTIKYKGHSGQNAASTA